MITFLMVLYVILALFLALFILIQPGKGDMGLGGMSNQMLFGGSGGQNFFEKTTWTLCVIFIFGALGLALLKTKEVSDSQLKGYKTTARALPSLPTKSQLPTKKTDPLPPIDQPITNEVPENPAEAED